MTLSEFTISLLFLFLPGIIGVLLIRTLTHINVSETKIFSLYAYLLSTISYLLLSIISSSSNFLNLLLEGRLTIDVREIIFSTIISICLSTLIVVAINTRLLYKMASTLKLSNRFGSTDVWISTFDAKETDWITIRPSVTKEYFVGKVKDYSDTSTIRELVLTDVASYNDAGSYIRSYEQIYFSFSSEQETVIEIGSNYYDFERLDAHE